MLKLHKTTVTGPNNQLYELHELVVQSEPELVTLQFKNEPTITVPFGEFHGNGFKVKCSLVSRGSESEPCLTWFFGDKEICKGYGYLIGEHDDAIVKVTDGEAMAASLNVKLPLEFHQWIEQMTQPRH